MLDGTVDIIILGFNLPEEEKACIESIEKNTDHAHVVTFFDNYNSGLSLTQAWNKLIKKSTCPYICLLNNDTVAYPNWLNRMMLTLLNYPKCGFVGPSTSNCHSPQKTIPTYELAETYSGKEVEMEQPISGFCLLFSKALWKALGGFNEQFAFYGSESDFVDRGLSLGYKAIWRQDSFVHHIGERSIKKSNMNVIVERNKARKLYWSLRGK